MTDDGSALHPRRQAPDQRLRAAGAGHDPRGVPADASDDQIYTYNMPAASDARLASLALSGIEIGEFLARHTEYQGVVAEDITETTLEATAMQHGTSVTMDPPDADGDDANGHQLALDGVEEITVTVTPADGSRRRVYRVGFPEARWDPARDPWPHCLRGAVSEGFSLIVYEGGSVEELVSCAESRDIVARYALHEGVYVPYILGAPDFVSREFRKLFPNGLPVMAPLVAGSNGPPSADPLGDGLDNDGQQPWPECLLGAVVEGFSLVAQPLLTPEPLHPLAVHHAPALLAQGRPGPAVPPAGVATREGVQLRPERLVAAAARREAALPGAMPAGDPACPPFRQSEAVLQHADRLTPARRAGQFPRAISLSASISSSLPATIRFSRAFSRSSSRSRLASSAFIPPYWLRQRC